jgi:V/A-type H+/Na+-transporting ATPase subunit F
VKIAIVTDAESALGYKLAGLEANVANDSSEAAEILARLTEEGECAVIAVNVELLPDPYATAKRQMRGRDLPVLLSAPSFRSAMAENGKNAEEYMRRLIVETMGYEIKL